MGESLEAVLRELRGRGEQPGATFARVALRRPLKLLLGLSQELNSDPPGLGVKLFSLSILMTPGQIC